MGFSVLFNLMLPRVQRKLFATASDPYKVLGISRSSSADEIKQAYRKLALKWHPDKNQATRVEAENFFKEISEAYQMLSDPAQKKNYDAPRGPTHANPHAYSHEYSQTMNMRQAEEIFKHMFGKGSPFAGFEVYGGRSQVESSEKIITKGGRRFLQRTRSSKKPDGSSVTEITETPLDP